MDNISKLYVQMVNHGQSEVWLGTESTEITNRRVLASNEVRNVIQRLSPEAFESFYKDWHVGLGVIATLSVPNLSEIAKELKLRSEE
jgi:hypothetical protein